MRVFVGCLILVLATCTVAGFSQAGWEGGACGPVGPSWTPFNPAPVFSPSATVQAHWRKCGCTSGCACGCSDDSEWCRCGNVPKPPCPCPDPDSCKCGCPDHQCRCSEKTELPTGVVSEKIEPYRNSVCGKDCSRQELLQVLQEGMVPADQDKLRVTLIGSDEDRARVEADLKSNPALAGLQDNYLLCSVRPDDWRVANLGFVTTGKPTIYCQSRSGQVLHRQDSYRGPEELAQVLRKAIRRADPNYDSKKDPDLAKPVIPDHPPPPAPVVPAPQDNNNNLLCCGVLLAALWFAFKTHQQSQQKDNK